MKDIAKIALMEWMNALIALKAMKAMMMNKPRKYIYLPYFFVKTCSGFSIKKNCKSSGLKKKLK